MDCSEQLLKGRAFGGVGVLVRKSISLGSVAGGAWQRPTSGLCVRGESSLCVCMLRCDKAVNE